MGQCACLGVTDVSTCVGLYLLLFQHFENWPKDKLICVHAEERTTAAVLLLAELYQRSVHVCHVARRDEVLRTHTHSCTLQTVLVCILLVQMYCISASVYMSDIITCL